MGSAIVATVGALTLTEYLFHVSFGIDQILFHPTFSVQRDLATQIAHPGRMAPLSCLCFFFVGLALLTLVGKAHRWQLAVSGTLASLVISLGFVALVGYLSGLPGFPTGIRGTNDPGRDPYGRGVHDSGCRTVSHGVWKSGSATAERTPRWLPVAVSAASATASFVLYFALDAKQNAEIVRMSSASRAESAESSQGQRSHGSPVAEIRTLVRMAARWEVAGGRSQDATWQTDADHYNRDFPEITKAIERWIDTSHRLRWITPLAGNESKLGTDLLNEERRAAAAAQAERERQPVITRAVTLFHGGVGYIIYVPVSVNGQPDGVLAAVFEAEPLFSRYLPVGVATGQAIRISDGSLTVFEARRRGFHLPKPELGSRSNGSNYAASRGRFESGPLPPSLRSWMIPSRRFPWSPPFSAAFFSERSVISRSAPPASPAWRHAPAMHSNAPSMK